MRKYFNVSQCFKMLSQMSPSELLCHVYNLCFSLILQERINLRDINGLPKVTVRVIQVTLYISPFKL